MVSRTSRKKNKGRERKAKKLETERARVRELWQGWAAGTVAFTPDSESILCDHGCGLVPEMDHLVSSFMDTYFNNWDNMLITKNMRNALQMHPKVWNDDSYKQISISILIRIGTKRRGDPYVEASLTLAKSIVILEHLDPNNGTGSLSMTLLSRRVSTKMRDLDIDAIRSSMRRDSLKFYSKRVTCSCLQSMHQEARKTIPKMGVCSSCKKVKGRVALSVCSRCMIHQYCSRECQVSAWAGHKKDCDIFFSTHESDSSNKINR